MEKECFERLKNLFNQSSIKTTKLNTTTKDERLNSAISEDCITEFITKSIFDTNNLFYKIPNKREWYDLLVVVDGVEFFINIKITEGKSADNISSKKGVIYSLTGNLLKTDRYDEFSYNLINEIKYDNKSDYYFLVIFKNKEPGKIDDILFTSLKRIKTLAVNGNNLPFQCNWSLNKSYSTRTKEEQIEYIISTIKEGLRKRAEPYIAFKEMEEKKLSIPLERE